MSECVWHTDRHNAVLVLRSGASAAFPERQNGDQRASPPKNGSEWGAREERVPVWKLAKWDL